MQRHRARIHRLAFTILLLGLVGALAGSAAADRPPHPARRGKQLPAGVNPNDPRWVLMLGDRARARLPQPMREAAVQKIGLKACAVRPNFVKAHNTNYSYVIPSRDKVPFNVANQAQSGRCWIFATNRVLDSIFSAKGVAAPQISPTYINYHSIREQVGALLAAGVQSKQPRLPQLRRQIETKGWGQLLSEGGWMSWAIDAVKKHGLVPEQLMPPTADGQNSGLLFEQARMLVTEAYGKMDKAKTVKQREKIGQQYLSQATRLLDATLGRPPQVIGIRTPDGKVEKMTPQEYMTKKLNLQASDLDFVTLVHDPGLPRNRRVRHDGHASRPPVEMYNVSMEQMQRATKRTLRKGQAVWFATAGNMSANPYVIDGRTAQVLGKGEGVMSPAAFDYKLFAPMAKPDKGTRISMNLIPTTHAMALVGYDQPRRPRAKQAKAGAAARKPAEPKKWLVENSWGPGAGDRGMLHMYNDFFKGHVEMVVVPRAAVPKALIAQGDKLPAINAHLIE